MLCCMQAEIHHYHSTDTFILENGFQFPSFDLVYQTWGKANAAQDNIIWICHAFTGSHDVAEWWQGLVGPGKLFNPENNLIIWVHRSFVRESPDGPTLFSCIS